MVDESRMPEGGWDAETGYAEAVRRIREEDEAQTGRLDISGLALEALPAEIAGLTHLRVLDAGWRYEGGGQYNRFSDLSPLSSLTALESLDCHVTQVSDLSPVSSLMALQKLNCRLTQVSDLSPLSSLTALQELVCGSTKVSDLSPLSCLTALQTLYCAGTQVSDLSPLSCLMALQTLDCGSTQVSDLSPLSSLTALQTLVCSGTQVSDLSPVFTHPALRAVDAYFLGTRVSALPPLDQWSSSLQAINLTNARISRLPDELFPADIDANHLPALRAYMADLDAAGAEAKPRAKLVVLGNGRVGKTQLRRRLMDLPFEAEADSTHGVEAHPVEIAHPGHANGVTLATWDFGGQDIYHGTHALFTRSRAVYVVCWHDAFETGYEVAENGLEFARRPLPYWLDFIRATAGEDVPVILVRTRSEDVTESGRPPAALAGRLEGFGYSADLPFGAATDRGLAELKTKLGEAITYLDEEYGAVRIGKARMDVIDALEAIRLSDQRRPPADRQYRTITRQHFGHICNTRDTPPHDKALLLSFLHHAGDVIHYEKLFGGEIILDQSWALDAIYALFDRDRCVTALKERAGRFTRNTLDTLAWAADGHGAEDQQRFIEMMVESDIAFCVSEGVNEDDPAQYIAPDFLPPREAMAPRLLMGWDEGAAGTVTSERVFDFVHDGVVRAWIADFGELAGPHGDYWKWGVQFYDEETGARARLEVTRPGGAEDPGAVLTLATQNGEAAALHGRLLGRLGRVQQENGLEAREARSDLGEAPEGRGRAAAMGGEDAGEPPAARPGREPRERPVVAVSYRRSGDPGTEALSTLIPAMTAAVPDHVDFIHDSDALQPGDGLNRFMDEEISAADRIGVLLSDSYLRSPYCMRELRGAWRLANDDKAAFNQKVHVWSVDGVDIYSAEARQVYLDYWQDRLASLTDIIARNNAANFDTTDPSLEKADILDFINNVGPILRVIADRVQGGEFDDYLARLLDGL